MTNTAQPAADDGLVKRAQQIGEWFAEYAEHHQAKADAIEALPGSAALAKVERNLERMRFSYTLQDDIATALTTKNAEIEALRHDIERSSARNTELLNKNAALQQRVEMQQRMARALRGWLEWYGKVDADDADCEYLNGKGWDDAEALACTTMGVLAGLDLRARTDQNPVKKTQGEPS